MIHAFCEGKTEQSVVEALGLKGTAHPHAIKLHDCGGKGAVNRKVHLILGAELGKAGANVRGVILRDLDEDETKEGIVENLKNQLEETLAQRGYKHDSIELTPHSAHENVYLLNLTAPNLRLAYRDLPLARRF